jgi:hypothetical protein
MALVRPVCIDFRALMKWSGLPQNMSFGSNVRNAPKHEFWVQWNGSGVFVTKNFEATLFSELVR